MKKLEEEKRYYVEYACPNGSVYWEHDTNHIDDIEVLTEGLERSQGLFIYDNKLNKCLFHKYVGNYSPTTNELREVSRDLRTKTGKRK